MTLTKEIVLAEVEKTEDVVTQQKWIYGESMASDDEEGRDQQDWRSQADGFYR